MEENTLTFEKSLESLLAEFGGTKYASMKLENMKERAKDVLSKADSFTPVEKATISKFITKISASKTKEKLLMLISEKMFMLSGEGI